jgi:CDP-4-dehydro-6-deoxyglucose reductase, E3
MQTNAAEVVRVHDLTHDVRELDLRLISPATLSFQPGQFISFEIPVEEKPYPMTRAYSIASPPSQQSVLTLVFNRVDHGPGSTFLFGLKPGDPIHFKGPAGSFRLRDDALRNLLFVATGTGIAPIRSMLHTLLTKGSQQLVTLLWGLRSQRDLYYQEELHKLATRYPLFHRTVTLSRPDPGWTGPTGRVTALVQERVKTVDNLAVYLCGNGGMIKDVTDFLRSKGLCPIYREKWYDEESEE